MSIKDLAASAHARHPGVELVTLKVNNPTAADVVGVKAARLPLSQKDIMIANQMADSDDMQTWLLWKSTMGSAVPKDKDYIVDSKGTYWVIINAQVLAVAQQVKAQTIRKQ